MYDRKTAGMESWPVLWDRFLGPEGDQIVLEQNLFLTAAFTQGVLTPVSPKDLDAYLAPYPTPESRRPILAWARQRPLGGQPADVVARIDAFDAWLAASEDVPGLATGADTFEDLIQKLKIVIPELLVGNGLLPAR